MHLSTLQIMKEEHVFEKLKWSVQSSDLNLIENLWYLIKTEIKLSGMRMRAMEGFKKAVGDVRDYIPRA